MTLPPKRFIPIKYVSTYNWRSFCTYCSQHCIVHHLLLLSLLALCRRFLYLISSPQTPQQIPLSALLLWPPFGAVCCALSFSPRALQFCHPLRRKPSDQSDTNALPTSAVLVKLLVNVLRVFTHTTNINRTLPIYLVHEH